MVERCQKLMQNGHMDKIDDGIFKLFEQNEQVSFKDLVLGFQRRIIEHALEMTRSLNGETNITHAADLLGINRPTLYMICERMNIETSMTQGRPRIRNQLRVWRKCQRCKHVEKRVHAIACSQCGCRVSSKTRI